jgi:hypothetical protein
LGPTPRGCGREPASGVVLPPKQLPDLVTAVAWERRDRSGPYYTRSRKVGGRVVREYVGGGVVGELAARLDALARQRREEEREAWLIEKEQLEAVDIEIEELCRMTDSLIKMVLTDAGYENRRGEWRRKRAERDARQTAIRRGEART